MMMTNWNDKRLGYSVTVSEARHSGYWDKRRTAVLWEEAARLEDEIVAEQRAKPEKEAAA